MTRPPDIWGNTHSAHLQRWEHVMIVRSRRVDVITTTEKHIEGIARALFLLPAMHLIERMWQFSERMREEAYEAWVRGNSTDNSAS